MSQRSNRTSPALAFTLLCLAAFLYTSCGAGSAAGIDASPQAEAERSASENVILTVLPDTYIAGGSAEAIEVTERQGQGELLVDVSVKGAVNLKAIYFHLDFDPARFGAGQLNSRFLLAPEEECLALYLASPGQGILEYGELIMLPQEPAADGSEKGFSGDGLLCTLHLRQLAPAQNKPAR